MAKSELILQLWGAAPLRDNDKSAKTYALIKPILERKFGNKVKIFLQGSYANSTNIKKDSDIDIVIQYKDSYFYDISNLSESEKQSFSSGFKTATYFFSDFKSDVLSCLEEAFGKYHKIERKDKCIRVHGNDNYVDADIVPCFTHKRFQNAHSTSAEGIELITDEGARVVSFPEQHIKNGETKNTNTATKYKTVVRILKNCKKQLIDTNVISDKLMSSFFVECLVWNIDNTYFNQRGYSETTKRVLEKLYADMKDEQLAQKYTEVNNLFLLIHPLRTKITRQDIMLFLEKTYNLIYS